MRLIENAWDVFWGSWANWTVLITSFVFGAVMQWHMAMFAFLAFLPWLWAQILGGGVVLVLLIAAPTWSTRVIAQRKLTEKIAAKTEEANRAANP